MTLWLVKNWDPGTIQEIEVTRFTELSYWINENNWRGQPSESRRARHSEEVASFDKREDAVTYATDRLKTRAKVGQMAIDAFDTFCKAEGIR